MLSISLSNGVSSYLFVCKVVLIKSLWSLFLATQSSTWNGMVASYSVDNNPSTCSSTGFGTGWIKIDFGNVMDVMAVTINGTYCRQPNADWIHTFCTFTCRLSTDFQLTSLLY